MRIALLTDKLELGGGLSHMRDIVRELPEFEFGIFARGGTAADIFDSLPNVRVFPRGYDPKYIQNFTPDILHFHHLKPLFSFYKNPFRKSPVPVLFTMHGAHIRKFLFRKGWLNRVLYQLRFRLEKYLFSRVTRLISVSAEDREFVRSFYGITNCIYIPNGIQIENYAWHHKTGKTELRKNLSLPEAPFLFLTIARFDYAKGYDILMRAIAILKEQFGAERVRFIFVGDGPLFGKIQRLSRDLKTGDWIDFQGTQRNIVQLLHAGDAFLLPSRWEGFPITLLEAGAAGLPVVATNTFGIRELIHHEKTGLLFQNEDPESLATLLKDVLEGKFDLTGYSKNLYDLIKTNFTQKMMKERLRQLYESF